MQPVTAALTRFERGVVRMCRFVNENPAAKNVQRLYHHYMGGPFVRVMTANRLHIEGLSDISALDPPGGVLLCANHRSFFDLFVIAAHLDRLVPWMERLYFPVRSNYFYETLGGVVINAAIAGLVMYPPIFRDPRKAELNKQALDTIADLLSQKGNVVGMHPEGTRGKGPDPYEMLPAQPGVGQVIMRSRPTVIPIWINGMGNNFVGQITTNFTRKPDPVVLYCGPPVQFGSLLTGTPRPAQYKRVADRVREAILQLGQKEKILRELL
jgi:1-acyl-sn-glycerol-3-phosphate acyltransferase